MIVAPTVTTIDIRHVLFVMLKHNVWYHILLFSKPQLRTATTGSSTAPLPWSNLYTYAHTELDEYYIIILGVVANCANIPLAEILQVTYCQFCHNALY